MFPIVPTRYETLHRPGSSDSFRCVGSSPKLLVVEDDAALRSTICLQTTLSFPDWTIIEASSLGMARKCLTAPVDLVLLDVALPDGRGTGLLPNIRKLDDSPAVVVMSGRATTAEAFELARMGVRAFVAKPIDLDQLLDALEVSMSAPRLTSSYARELVGQRSISDVQSEVRQAMVEQALFLTGGNRTAAARILGVTRQAVQHMVREFEIDVASYATKVART